jgi:hypothetical protein
MGGIVISSCCYGPRHCNLTLSILACPAGRLRNMGDVIGGLERTNGEAASEAEVGPGREFLTFETLLRGLR